ncbi:MAG: autotransporter-associated beta strand repeat-containing protein, partial [Burkholderiaceae bacterium]|nr:autotransporter-associated beta strand repeat-containing protein [Burkholderiaceae bacterium]
VFDQAIAGTYAGAMSGSGSLVKQGSATLTLTGNNSYGGGTTLEAGTLTLGSAGAIGSVGVIEFGGGTLQFSAVNTTDYSARFGIAGGQLYRLDTNGQDVSLAAALTSAGGVLSKSGAGTLTLGGANRYSGGTTVAAGTLSGNADSLQGAITNNAVVVFDQATTGTYAGAMTGSGGLVKQGGGTLTLSGTNSYGGGTTVSAGTLSGNTDSLQGAITNNAVVVFDQATAGTYAGAMGGSGSLVKQGGATLTLSGANGYSGGTTVSAGTLTGNTESLQGAIANDAVVVFDQATAGTYAGAMSGGGSLVKQGGGSLTLAGANLHAGVTRVDAGTLVLAGGAAVADVGTVRLADGAGAVLALQADETIGALAGGAGGQVLLGSHMLSTGADNLDSSFAGVIGGDGRLLKLGRGTFTLTGPNTYAGGTTLAGGVLSLAADAQLGQVPAAASAGHLLFDGGTLRATDSFTLAPSRGVALQGGGGTLQVDAGKTLVVPGVLADGASAGSLRKTGAGTLQLTSGENQHSGATAVQGGVLAITSDRQLGAVPGSAVPRQLVLDGGTLRVDDDIALAPGRGLWLGDSGGAIDVQAGRRLDIAGPIDGSGAALAMAGSLTKLGDGRLSLLGDADNHYPGATRVLAGTLAISHDGQLGHAPALATPGQLLLDTATLQVDGTFQLDARRGLALGDAGGTISVAAGQSLGYAGTIADAGTGAGTLRKTGEGRFSLEATSPSLYRGATVVDQGVLAISDDRQLGAVPLAAAPGHLRLDGGTLFAAGSLTLAEQRGLELGPAGGTLDVAAGQSLRYGGVLADAGSGGRLIKEGGGQLQFTGPAANTYAGGTSLRAGALVVDRDDQLGAAPAQPLAGHLLLDGGALQFQRSTVLDSRRGIALGAAGGSLVVAAGADVSYNGVAADAPGLGAAGGELVKDGAGRFTLGGDNRHLGATRVLGGTLATAGTERLPDGGLLLVGNHASLSLGGDETIAGLADADPALADGSARVALGANTLTVVTPAGSDLRFGGAFTSQGGSLVKRGEGRLQLTGGGVGNSLVQVEEGRLLSVGANSLSPEARVDVAPAGTLQVQTAVSVGSIALGGLLDGPGALFSKVASVDNGQVRAALTTGMLTSRSASLLDAAVVVSGTTTVDGGTLTLDAGASLRSKQLEVLGDGTLATLGSGQLLGSTALQVAAGSRLQLAGTESVASLALAGTLEGSGRLDVTGPASLQDARVDAPLRSATLSSLGNGQVHALVQASERATLAGGTLTLGPAGRLETPHLAIAAGTLVTRAAQALGSATAVTVQPAGTLLIGGDTTVTTLQLLGMLGAATPADAGSAARLPDQRSLAAPAAAVPDGAPTLSVSAAALLDGASVTSPLAAAQIAIQGNTTIAAPVRAAHQATLAGGLLLLAGGGALDAPVLQLDAGTLRTSAAQQIDAGAMLRMAPGSTLQLGGNQALSVLADTGAVAAGASGLAQVDLGSFEFGVGAGDADMVFSGHLTGSGSLVKQGAGTLVLRAEQAHGSTRIESGILQLGDGGSSGGLGAGPVFNQGVLRFLRSDEALLAQAISGPGMLQQSGSGTLSVTSGALTYTGETQVGNGVLRTSAAERLPDGSTVRVAANARLVLGGDETIAAISADGAVSLGGSVTSAGDQRYRGPVSVDSVGPITLIAPGASVEALHDDNRWGEQPLSVRARQLLLSAGRQADGSGSRWRDLVLGSVTLGAADTAGGAESSVDAGQLRLGQDPAAGQAASGDARLDGLLRLDSGSLHLRAHAAASYQPLPAEEDKSRPVDPLKGRELWVADDVLSQRSASRVLTAAGSQLVLQAMANASIRFDQPANQVAGGLSALSGADWNAAWAAADLPAGQGAGQSRISLGGGELLIGGRGIEADLVRLSAGRLATDPGSAIVARLWYNDSTYGVQQSTAGLQLTLLPEAYASPGSFGTVDRPLAVAIGSNTLGAGREGLSAGYVQVLPRKGAQGTTAVLLAGPKVGEAGYTFFHDGAGDAAELPVIYNGVLPATPQLTGSLSAVASVSETARRERFDEAVRTENVAIRLRAGVIAEVGPGRPATQGSQGLRMPSTCTAASGRLGCPASVGGAADGDGPGSAGGQRGSLIGRVGGAGARPAGACAPGDGAPDCTATR